MSATMVMSYSMSPLLVLLQHLRWIKNGRMACSPPYCLCRSYLFMSCHAHNAQPPRLEPVSGPCPLHLRSTISGYVGVSPKGEKRRDVTILGILPREFSKMARLKILSIQGCSVGRLPEQTVMPPNVEELDFYQSSFQGELLPVPGLATGLLCYFPPSLGLASIRPLLLEASSLPGPPLPCLQDNVAAVCQPCWSRIRTACET